MYYVRINEDRADLLDKFCSRNKIYQEFITSGWQHGAHSNTVLYKIKMSKEDATAMKMTLQVEMAEIKYNE